MPKTASTAWLTDAFSSALDLGKSYMSNGHKVGDFVMSDTALGEGGYGKVFKGTNKITGEQVAIKVIDT